MSEWPERIWLQVEDEYDGLYGPGDEITWCQDKINESDVEYVRADEVAKLEGDVERLRETQASILERAERAIEGEKWNLAEFVVKKIKG